MLLRHIKNSSNAKESENLQYLRALLIFYVAETELAEGLKIGVFRRPRWWALVAQRPAIRASSVARKRRRQLWSHFEFASSSEAQETLQATGRSQRNWGVLPASSTQLRAADACWSASLRASNESAISWTSVATTACLNDIPPLAVAMRFRMIQS